MSIFDAPKQEKIQDVFPEGNVFILHSAKVEGQVDTQYGPKTLGKVLVSPKDDPAAKSEFAVWGSLCEQIQQMESGELPAIVGLQHENNKRWLFYLSEKLEGAADASETASA